MKPVQYSEENTKKTLLENELEIEPYELDDKELNIKRDKVVVNYLESLSLNIKEPEEFISELELTEKEKEYIIPFLYKILNFYGQLLQEKKQTD